MKESSPVKRSSSLDFGCLVGVVFGLVAVLYSTSKCVHSIVHSIVLQCLGLLQQKLSGAIPLFSNLNSIHSIHDHRTDPSPYMRQRSYWHRATARRPLPSTQIVTKPKGKRTAIAQPVMRAIYRSYQVLYGNVQSSTVLYSLFLELCFLLFPRAGRAATS
jgi:hypothetical protein